MNAVLSHAVDMYSARKLEAPDPVEIDVCRAGLTPAAKEACDELLPQLRKDAKRIRIQTSCSADEAKSAYRAAVLDHPDLFWLKEGGRIGCEIIMHGDEMILVPRGMTSEGQRGYARRQMTKTLRGIEATIPASASDYDIALIAYKWACGHVLYDRNAPHGQTAVGPLSYRRAVCSGIAEAYCLILRSMGVPCGCISGNDKLGIGHRWNIIRINGTYTFVDCTNGRLKWNTGIGHVTRPELTYRYLCFSTRELRRCYSIDSGQEVPLCLTQSYDWFVLNDTMLGPAFSVERLDACLCNAVANGKSNVEVKCENDRAYRECLKALEDGTAFKGRFGSLLASPAGAKVMLAYSPDDAMRTIIITW